MDAVIQWAFGGEIVNDPKFSDLTHRLVETIFNRPETKVSFTRMVDDVTQ
jgi:hypothetical protein